jgi:subtilase family serine protease
MNSEQNSTSGVPETSDSTQAAAFSGGEETLPGFEAKPDSNPIARRTTLHVPSKGVIKAASTPIPENNATTAPTPK